MKPAPARVPNRDRKIDKILSMQGYNCAIAEAQGKFAEPHEVHHAGVPNTKVNRKLYPRLMHSLWNLKLVNHWFHMRNGSFGRFSFEEARKREAFLQAHPCIAKALNMED